MLTATPSAATSEFARPPAGRRPQARAALLLAAVLAAFGPTPHALAQFSRLPLGGLGGEHTIFGEVKIDDSKIDKDKGGLSFPDSFELVLATEFGKEIERRTVINRTLFRFNGLRNGSYELVVESGGLPVARVRVLLDSPQRLEQRQDVALAWDSGGQPKADGKKGVVSAGDYYARPAATRGDFEQAVNAVKKKKFADAASLLRRVVEADPKDHLAWAHLGSVHNSLGQTAEAERAYERALSLRPEMLSAAFNLSRLYFQGENYGKAVELLRPVAAKMPDSADAHFLLGEAYFRIKRFDEAGTHLKEAIRLDPNGKANAHLGMAAIHDAAGSKDKAAAELEQFLAKRPGHPERSQFEQSVRANKKR